MSAPEKVSKGVRLLGCEPSEANRAAQSVPTYNPGPDSVRHELDGARGIETRHTGSLVLAGNLGDVHVFRDWSLGINGGDVSWIDNIEGNKEQENNDVYFSG